MTDRGPLRPLLWTVAFFSAGCDGCQNPPPPQPELYHDEELAAEVFEEAQPPPADAPAPPAIGETLSAPRLRAPHDREPAPARRAAHHDRAYASDETVHAARYVYRVRMVVPPGLGTSTDRIALPAAELVIDVSQDRLRAQFIGSGWPVPAGSQVRLRRDRPGVYLFDGAGGRPLEPGELARWFEGGHVTRRGPPLRIIAHGLSRPDEDPSEPLEEIPGELVCALLAEWAGEERENHMRRCHAGAPQLWRLGFWRAEQTARVPLEVPRSALRADEHDRPDPIRSEHSRAFLEPEALSRIRPKVPAGEGLPRGGLRVRNASATRVILTAQGIVIGWVDAGHEGWFEGLEQGTYRVSALRPLGAVVLRQQSVVVPGVTRVCDGRCAR